MREEWLLAIGNHSSLGMPYLDVIYRLKEATNLPIAAYHVSGEYAMLKAASQKVHPVFSQVMF